MAAMCGFTMTVKVLTVWKLWGHCEMWDMLCFQVMHRPRASGYNQAGLGVSQKWRQPFSSPGPLLFFTLRFTLLKIFLNLSLWIIWKRRYYSEKQSNNHLLMVAWDEYREGTPAGSEQVLCAPWNTLQTMASTSLLAREWHDFTVLITGSHCFSPPTSKAASFTSS